MKEQYLVTPALPYVNGPTHLGHLLEHVQVNVFVRSLRMANKDVLYVCGADSHGTPIELSAQKAKKSPEQFTKEWQSYWDETFRMFGIEFDGGFGTTHTPENERHACIIYNALKNKGHIFTKDVEQLFDPELKRFLPDRMVRGICPKCKAPDQYGDSCEVCGSTYRPTELIEPRSVLSGATPILKKSLHYFFRLADYTEALKNWTQKPGVLQLDTLHFLKAWFEEGLKDWDISRDGPYFGFKIPGEDNKYFYVWLDAPVGYISLSDKALKEQGRSFEEYWRNPDAKIIHFIGKDIVYFHTLFWPAMLMGAEYTLPSKVVVHGMLTIGGQKMSKSRGTFVLARTLAKYIEPEALRYYLACKLAPHSEDIDLNLNDFAQRVNVDLVNKIVNLISRTLPMLHQHFEGQASAMDDNAFALIEQAQQTARQVALLYLACENSKAIKEIVALAEEGNRYLQEQAPWNLVKSDKALAHRVMTTGLFIGKVCFGLLKPVLPKTVGQMEIMLCDGEVLTFETVDKPFRMGQQFPVYTHLFHRIEDKQVQAMLEETKKNLETHDQENSSKETPKEAPLSPPIDIDTFMQIELRAARVLGASDVEGTDKLIGVDLDVGPFGQRKVFAGLKPFVKPADLLGKTVVLVVNLKPRKMRFGTSEGMILACGEDSPKPIFLEGVKPGDRVR